MALPALRRASLVLGLLAFFAVFSAAQDATRPHPLSNLPPAGEILTGFFFPDYPTRQFIAGEPVKLVLGIRNEASEDYNISMIMGSLNNAQEFRAYYWNFTQQFYFQIVEPSKELSVEYTFLPPKDLPSNDYQVALTVFYEDTAGFKSTTFFNQTITVLEKGQLIDWKLLFLYIIFVSLIVAGGYFAWGSVKDSAIYKNVVGKKVRRVETVRPDGDDEWVKGTPYDNFRKKKAAAASKGSPKKTQ